MATAARNLSELGYLDVSDKALTGERTPALDQATRSVHKEQNKNNNANLSEDAAYGPQTQAAVIPALRRLRDMQAAGLKPSMPAPQSVAKPEVPVAPNDLIAYALGEVSKPWLQSGPSAPDIGGSVQTASLATGETNAGLHGAPLVSEVRPNDLGYAPVEPVDPGVEVAIAPAAVLGALALAARAAAPTVVPPDKELLKRLPTILSRKGKYADEDTVFIPPVITSENLDNQLEPKPKEPKLAILPPDDEKEADGASKEDKVDQPSTEYAPKAWDLSHAIQREFFLDEFSRDVIGEAFDQRTRAAKKKHGGSRGDFFPTQHGNELAADECRKVLKRNYSDMSDCIDHIGGAYEDGKGIIYLKELQISDPNNYKDWGRPDLSWRVNDAEYAKRIGSPTAHLNTQTTRKSGKPAGAERFSLNRLQRLHLLQEGVTRAIVHGIPKMKKGHSDDEYRKIAEKGCEDIFADWLG